MKDFLVFGHLVESLQDIIGFSAYIKLQYINRNINTSTHLLVKFTCDILEVQIWMEEVLCCINFAVSRAVNGTSLICTCAGLYSFLADKV